MYDKLKDTTGYRAQKPPSYTTNERGGPKEERGWKKREASPRGKINTASIFSLGALYR